MLIKINKIFHLRVSLFPVMFSLPKEMKKKIGHVIRNENQRCVMLLIAEKNVQFSSLQVAMKYLVNKQKKTNDGCIFR